MPFDRRSFMRLLTGSAVAGLAAAQPQARAASTPRLGAVAFDAFPILDPRPIFAFAESLFPGKGTELGNLWRTRQFEYTWLRTVGQRYVDFWRVTEDALVFAAKSLGLELSSDTREQLMGKYLELKAWPDAAPALRSLKQAGIRMAFLSNFTPAMLDAGIRNSGLEGFFEDHLSTDRARAFKPAARAYEMGVEAFGLPREQIAFVASAGWDAAGAKWFGYPTVWINRAGLPVEDLNASPDAICKDLDGLVSFVNSASE
jgi:2-haloacid dehalogenase